MQTNTTTHSEVLNILETYEEMLRREWRADLLAKWTEWKAVLCRMEGQ